MAGGFPNLKRFGTASVLGGVNIQPGLELEKIKQRQREDAARRAEFISEQGRLREGSLADRKFREQAYQGERDDAMFLRGLKGRELEEAIAARTQREAEQKYRREQDVAQGQRADRELDLREQQQSGAQSRFDDVEAERKLNEQADVTADQLIAETLGNFRKYSDLNLGEGLSDENWQQIVTGAVMGRIKDPDAPGAMALKRALTKKIVEATDRRKAERKERERAKKEADAEAERATHNKAVLDEREEGKKRASRDRKLAIIDRKLARIQSEAARIEAQLSATRPDGTAYFAGEGRKRLEDKLAQLQGDAADLQDQEDSLMAEE